jgi:FkbM family methyltransferase
MANPNITLVNKAVGRSTGRALLHYIDQDLAGASLTEPPYFANGTIQRLGVQPRQIEVETTAIDDYLPEGLAVDLVKIDVEGHEPYVLMGMEGTIRRSPRIRIIAEYIEDLLRHTVPARQFAEYIYELGFRVCAIRKDWQLELYERGAALPVKSYLLLTRSPEADIRTVARRRRAPRRWLKRALQGAAIDIGALSHRL